MQLGSGGSATGVSGRPLTPPDAATSPVIGLESVSRSFPRVKVQALRDVSLDIDRGEYMAITGPSGSGKSTLLYLAAGMYRPDSGRVQFEGRTPAGVAEWTRLRATRIGFVFQAFHLIAGLTAAENVELPMLGVIASERERRQRVARLLDRVHLSGRASSRAVELSGGEAQRVAIARAMANSPGVILADEPTGNLDSHTSAEVLALMEQLHREEHVALVIVTHDPGVAERASRGIHLRDGEIVSDERRRPRA